MFAIHLEIPLIICASLALVKILRFKLKYTIWKEYYNTVGDTMDSFY